MASVTSLTSSSGTSSIYGNRNIISGLASGMDTEAMIENSIAGYKAKINKLQQRMTKTQWKQDAYRNIITQMNGVLSKYTSYTSSTNLFSSSFFTKAVITAANGANAAKVAASGKATSDIQLDRVLQLAQAASYNTGTEALTAEGSATGELKLDGQMDTSGVEGSITIKYGGGTTGSGSNFTLRFDEGDVYKDAQEFADAINEQLKENNIRTGSGTSSADKFIKAEVTEDGRVVLNDVKGNYFAVTGVSGKLANYFEKTEADGRVIASKAPITEEKLADKVDTIEYLKDKSLTFNLDGKAKTIKLDFVKEGMSKEDFVKNLQDKVNDAYGKGKISVGLENGALKFGGANGEELTKGSTLTVSGSSKVNEALGMKEAGYSNTLQTGWKLSDVLSKDKVEKMFTEKQKDAEGKEIKDSEAEYATITINGHDIQVSKDDTIKNVMDKINSSEAGVDIKYSNLTGRFSMNAKDTGADTKIAIEGDLGKELFGLNEKVTSRNITKSQRIDEILTSLANKENWNTGNSPSGTEENDARLKRLTEELASLGYKQGQDAQFDVTVNGEKMTLTRSSNTVNLDGLTVTLKGTFGYKTDNNGALVRDDMGNPVADTAAEPVTFTTTSDSDKIVDAIKSFIEDYNKLATDLHAAYTTEPLRDSSKNFYEPLTGEQEDKMSETELKNYNEKAQTGLLFGDSDLSNLYSRLTSAVQGDGEVGSMLRSIGINVKYSNRLTTLDLDEDALRDALENNPDRVKDAFTQTTANGASKNGLMANLKGTLEMYGSTSIASPGILVNKAGSTLSSYSLSNNELNDQMENLQDEIEKWQDKMSDRIDYYTNQFTQLEMLINKMNSQSSMLAGLSGGY